jgi:hypothetical protein
MHSLTHCGCAACYAATRMRRASFTRRSMSCVLRSATSRGALRCSGALRPSPCMYAARTSCACASHPGHRTRGVAARARHPRVACRVSRVACRVSRVACRGARDHEGAIAASKHGSVAGLLAPELGSRPGAYASCVARRVPPGSGCPERRRSGCSLPRIAAGACRRVPATHRGMSTSQGTSGAGTVRGDPAPSGGSSPKPLISSDIQSALPAASNGCLARRSASAASPALRGRSAGRITSKA